MPENEISEIPDYLRPAQELLIRAFPEGPSRDSYLGVLLVMAPHFSSRNLALVIHHAFQIPYPGALNDVYGARGGELELASQAIEEVTQKLRSAGYDEWLKASLENGDGGRS